MLSIYNFLKIKLCYRTYWKQWLAFLTMCFLVFACSGGDGGSDDNNPCPNQPQLTTLEVSNITYNENTDLASATFSGEIQNIQLGANCETYSITNQGFVYSTNVQPTTSDNVVNANGENASANVSDLMPETTYYVRAYLTNTLGTFYGNEVSFTTPQSTNPVYLAENGVTIKAKDWAVVGDSGIVNGITYTIVNREILVNMISNQEDVTRVCTTRVVNMEMLFEFSDFNQNINSWDVSNVTNMSYMFSNNSTFNQPIGDWDVSNVTNMSTMFNRTNFNQDISSWDVSNVINMSTMFENSRSFNQDISGWDVSNVTNMSYMFFNDYANWPSTEQSVFNQDLSNWDVSSVTNCSYFSCFQSVNFELGGPIESWTLPQPNFNNCDSSCD